MGQQQQQQAQAAQIQQQQQQQAAIAAALSAGVNPMVAAGNPLAIAALQAQQHHPLMAQQASAQLAAAQQSGLVMTPQGLMILPRGQWSSSHRWGHVKQVKAQHGDGIGGGCLKETNPQLLVVKFYPIHHLS